MHPDVQLAIHGMQVRELERELELGRSMRDCPRCILRARPRLRRVTERIADRLSRSGASTPSACCPA